MLPNIRFILYIFVKILAPMCQSNLLLMTTIYYPISLLAALNLCCCTKPSKYYSSILGWERLWGFLSKMKIFSSRFFYKQCVVALYNFNYVQYPTHFNLRVLIYFFQWIVINSFNHGLRTPTEEIVFAARLKIHSHSKIFSYSRSIFCLPHRPKF